MSRDKRIKKILAYVLLLVLAFTNIGFGREPISVYATTKYVVIYFVDNTTEQWVGNDAAVMELVDNTNGHDSYWMTQKDDVTWCVTVPESACNITFNRYSSDKSTKWNSWSAGGRDENNAYYADGAEYGHWDVVEEGENYFHAGDIIYLDLSEFLDWEKDDALMYINFSDASKEENGGNDISISNADKSLYEPQKVSDKVDEYVYQYIFTEDSEGAVNLRFWRGNSDTLWNYSLVLSYEEYLDGINCIKVKDWDNAGVILAHNIEIDIEKDSDNDGLSDDYEDKIGTNKAKKDTDNDGLSDYIEVSLGYSPVLSDTDDDGIIDGEEDFEGDGLTNKEEVNIGTDISWWDTDDDGLDDYDEINNYYTLPLMEDTDSDGIVDGIEVKFGLNPLEKDGNGDGIEDALEKITYLFDAKLMIDDYDKNVYPQVELSGDIKTLDSFEISIKENNYIINQRIPGYIGNAYEFTTESEFESAKVTFYIEPSLFEDENFLPAIYYFNEEEQFEEEYRKSNKKQVCTWIGNNIYGSNDEVQIYEQALIDYFKTINLGFVTEIEGRERIEMLLQYMGIVGSVVDEARISLKNDANAIDELLELEKQIETLKISIIDAANSSNGFTKADFYEQYDILQGYLADASKKSDDIKAALNKNVTVKGKIMTFAQGKDATVGAKTLVWTSNILQVGMDCMEEYDDYISLKANMETLQENIYILEILSESAYNENVKKAASSLLSVARTEYINLEKEILDAFGSGVLNLVLHELISKVPVVGFWVELGLSLGSIIIPLSDVSQCAVRVCGDSCMATILAADLKNYLSRDINKILTGQEIYVVDSDSINEVIKKYINLVEMRKFGENDMIELQKSGAGIVKWLLDKSGHDTEEIISECETTIEYLEWLKGLYSFKSFQKSNG